MRPTDPHDDPRLLAWLEAEASDDAAGADEALRMLFAEMPRQRAPEGLVARVMAETAALPPPFPLERLAVGLLLLCAVALSVTPLWLGDLWERLSPQFVLAGLADGLVWFADAVAALAPLGLALVKAVSWLSAVGGTPEVLTFLASCVLLAGTAGRLLVSVLEERSAGHAQT
jgi:hypothetical protein